jgi:hypothetical protein
MAGNVHIHFYVNDHPYEASSPTRSARIDLQAPSQSSARIDFTLACAFYPPVSNRDSRPL